ncbi:DUF3857 domain-containing protein [Ferruginibacter albus]|uniref:DUF3857 domain-containing protein n=1 Tax=Ferruginibacter albus TaxID=2875540 RepID=UPI001CC3FD6F|nr:DUF3857 domain-containing protein [Ferruginibacter albus]UAY51434.1 DUF3857 and transglutaminase domain-containing protein [Ferruginibacter albus]
MMKRIACFLLLNICWSLHIAAQENKYAVSAIPVELLKNANAVKRVEELKIIINTGDKATIYQKYAITILNEGGDHQADFVTFYDAFRDVKHIEGKLYDANGKKIRSMKKDDLEDISAVGANIITDGRVKHHNFQCRQYPYTIEYESETDCDDIFFLPAWQPVEDDKYAVQLSALQVQCPASYTLRYRMFNYNKAPDSAINNAVKTYNWSVENIAAVLDQQYQPDWYKLTPTVFLAPSDFKMQDYDGNMNTWKGFGEFITALNEGRDELPDAIKQTVHSLTDKIQDVHEKIRLLYEYMQKNTRYVGIQLGIGGWQPFSASYVATKGYGDCKALSNYMCSLLREAGIKADYVLILAGRNKTGLIDDFPCNLFNHAIACVPMKTDTVWLECTSQILPAGYLSGFTCNRSALLIDGGNSKLVHTPDYEKRDNIQLRKIKATVDSTGFLQLDADTKYACLQQDALFEMIHALSKEKIKDELREKFNLPSFDLVSYKYSEEKNSMPVVEENVQITSGSYATISGKRLFVMPNILSRYENKFTDYEKRTCDIVIKTEYRDIDTVEITIPKGYSPEALPADVSIESKFGRYSCSAKVSAEKITYYRMNERVAGVYPASDGKVLADYLNKISKADREKIVFVKNG